MSATEITTQAAGEFKTTQSSDHNHSVVDRSGDGYVPIDIRMDNEIIQNLKDIALLKGVSVDQVVEDALQQQLNKINKEKNYLTEKDINDVITNIEYNCVPNTHITICVLTLINGAKVLGKNYGSIDPDRNNEVMGKEYAFKEAVEKVWELEGYLLRQRLYDKQKESKKE